ncbi:MAG: DNA-processing protein DprA [Tissierellia bacterium]|nr:DNA-processing protein DprA [Tissierellia bacterium]
MKNRDVLIFLNGIGLSSNMIFRILENLEALKREPVEIFNMNLSDLKDVSAKSVDKIEKNIKRKDEIFSKIQAYGERLQASIITIFDSDYPRSLTAIDDPPAVLYQRGQNFSYENTLAFVGARKHTAYGRLVIERLMKEMAPYNFTIVSGMAFGIDALSHEKALEHGMKTIAVLGTGIDVIYPKNNSNLYHRLLEEGMVLTEYPFGTRARPYHFPQRNRIISGLSQSVVVVEAKDKSGSLITARLAAEQGKEVFAVPGNINSPYSIGTNKLIRDGAFPLIEIDDILDFYPNLQYRNLYEKEEIQLTSDERLVYNLIELGHKEVDSICKNTKYKVPYINTVLTMLELKGLIEKISMNQFEIK